MAQPTRVLIADDNVRTRDGLRALLATRLEIAVVAEAGNGQEALRLVAEHHPDVVLMDLQMPVLNGFEATRQIKQHWPGIMVIALTMYASERDAAYAAGADAFIIKGGPVEQLLRLIHTAGASGDSASAMAPDWHTKGDQ